MTDWRTTERPGYLGQRRELRYSEWNARYGDGNWRLAWKIGESFADFLGACALYEDAYYAFMLRRADVTEQLVNEACEVYDDEPSNVASGFDYLKQETGRTHVQDIAIRRSILRMGIWFRGTELIRIRHKDGTHPLSMTLSPGKVPFHQPILIEEPEIKGWWDLGSVEAFYQSNKYLQVRK